MPSTSGSSGAGRRLPVTETVVIPEGYDCCPECSQAKPLADFGRNRRRPVGCELWCIACQKTHRQAQHDRRLAEARQRRGAEQAAVFGHYGRSCACCRSTKRLCIDHIANNGREHRAEVGEHKVYRWLIAHGFPEGFQTLCGLCNSSKRTGTRCRLDHGKTEGK